MADTGGTEAARVDGGPVDVRRAVPAELLELVRNPVSWGRALGYTGLLDELHGEAWRFMRGKERVYVELPRGHYKSTFVSVVLVSWEHLRDPRNRTMLMSAKLDLARDLIEEIRDRMHGPLNVPGWRHRRVYEVFPWMYTAGGARRAHYSRMSGLNFRGRSGLNRERSVFPMAVGASAAGRHPTRVYVDDLHDEQNTQTEGQVAKVIRAYETLTPLLRDLRAPLRVVGTPWTVGDLSWHLRVRLGVPTFRKAIWDGVNPATGVADGCGPGPGGAWPLAPTILDAAGILELCREPRDESPNPLWISPERFSCWYMLEPIAGGGALFDAGLVERATDARLGRGLPDVGYEVVLVDPAIKSGRSGLVVLRVMRAGDLGLAMPVDLSVFVVVEAAEVAGGIWPLHGFLRKLVERRDRLRGVLIEEVAAQHVLVPWMEESLPNEVTIEPVPIRSAMQQARHQGLQAAMMTGRVRLLPEFPGRDLLVQQMLGTTPSGGAVRDDVLDAAALVGYLPREYGEVTTGERALEPMDPNSLLAQKMQEARMRKPRHRSWPGKVW